ncbi:MAG: hypothetical protein DCC49_11505 [Acidobacteria bacterium]|nr:MAG: hypothetical protein DCC49_11505 [Acidobacteriota bacterium]
MDESHQQQPHSGTVSSSSGSSGWATPVSDGAANDSPPNSQEQGAMPRSNAVKSGSPIPARPGKPSKPDDAQYATTGTLRPAPNKANQMAPKAVAGIVAAAVVLTLGIVVLLYLMTQGSNDPRPAAEDRTVQPPPASGPTDAIGAPRQVSLEGLSLLLPAGWNYEKVQDGYNLGPSSNPSHVKIFLNYKGTSLSRLRPACESTEAGDETPEPSPTSDDQGDTESPDRTSPSPSPSPSTTPAISGITKDTYTLIGGEQAISESGSYECDSQDARPFNSIIVTSKGFAMAFGEPTVEVNELMSSIVFE